ncbi:MAG: hypothetical protein WC634_05710 [archaeon]
MPRIASTIVKEFPATGAKPNNLIPGVGAAGPVATPGSVGTCAGAGVSVSGV